MFFVFNIQCCNYNGFNSIATWLSSSFLTLNCSTHPNRLTFNMNHIRCRAEYSFVYALPQNLTCLWLVFKTIWAPFSIFIAVNHYVILNFCNSCQIRLKLFNSTCCVLWSFMWLPTLIRVGPFFINISPKHMGKYLTCLKISNIHTIWAIPCFLKFPLVLFSQSLHVLRAFFLIAYKFGIGGNQILIGLL